MKARLNAKGNTTIITKIKRRERATTSCSRWTTNSWRPKDYEKTLATSWRAATAYWPTFLMPLSTTMLSALSTLKFSRIKLRESKSSSTTFRQFSSSEFCCTLPLLSWEGESDCWMRSAGQGVALALWAWGVRGALNSAPLSCWVLDASTTVEEMEDPRIIRASEILGYWPEVVDFLGLFSEWEDLGLLDPFGGVLPICWIFLLEFPLLFVILLIKMWGNDLHSFYFKHCAHHLLGEFHMTWKKKEKCKTQRVENNDELMILLLNKNDDKCVPRNSSVASTVLCYQSCWIWGGRRWLSYRNR